MKYRVILLAIGMMLCTVSCGKTNPELWTTISNQAEEEENQPEEVEEENTLDPEETMDEPEEEIAQESETEPEENTGDDFSFEEFKNMDFLFSSGAGGWGTIMNINSDGSFEGNYHDSEMGLTGDGYPHGTVYMSDFTGQFSKPEKVNDNTYSIRMEDISYEREPDTEEIKDEQLVIYAEAYGLAGGDKFTIYTPGTPLDSLSEELRSWIGFYDLSQTDETQLQFYVLSNEKDQYGFVGHDIVADLKEQIQLSEDYLNSLEQELQNDAASQEELAQKAQDFYNEWDYLLNRQWRVLGRMLDENSMSALKAEQREWIAKKEQKMGEEKARSNDFAKQDVASNVCGAKMTKERFYELMEYLE